MTPMFNPEFAAKVFAGIDEGDRIFQNFQHKDCGCIKRFGYCACTNLERACRYVSQQQCGKFFSDYQREILISESVYQSEGGYEQEKVKKFDDIRLARVWMETANDYVQSQL